MRLEQQPVRVRDRAQPLAREALGQQREMQRDGNRSEPFERVRDDTLDGLGREDAVVLRRQQGGDVA
jgi:hypothetical protein